MRKQPPTTVVDDQGILEYLTLLIGMKKRQHPRVVELAERHLSAPSAGGIRRGPTLLDPMLHHAAALTGVLDALRQADPINEIFIQCQEK